MDQMTTVIPSAAEPRSVSQYMLNRTGHALMTGDLPLYLSCYILPHHIQTFEGRHNIRDIAALTQVFHDVRSDYARLGVTSLERYCTQATSPAPDRVNAHYVSRALAGSQLVYRPFPALTELHFVDGDWRVGNCQYAIADAPHLVQALLGPRT